MSKDWTFWNPDEVEILKKLADAGYEARAISSVLEGRSIESIRNKMKRMGLQVARAPSNINYDLYRQMLKLGDPK